MPIIFKKHQSQQIGNAGGLNKDLSGGIEKSSSSKIIYSDYIKLVYGNKKYTTAKKLFGKDNKILETMFILSHLPQIINQNSFADSVEKKQANENNQLKVK